MSRRKIIFTALLVSLGLTQLPCARAEDPSTQQQDIAEKLNAAFGDNILFSKIALEFVDKSKANFSCKWWVMKASQQHNSDVRQISNSPESAPYRQKYMVESILTPLKEACSQ